MKYIKNIFMISFLSINQSYNSDYYLFKFHPRLPLHYRAEMFLLDNRYNRLTGNVQPNQDKEFSEIFENMEYLVGRLSDNKLAQEDYQKVITAYKNKVIELKKLKRP